MSAFRPILLQKSFSPDARKFQTLVSALWSIPAIETSKIDFREILGAVRFSTFATVSARSGRSPIFLSGVG